MAQRDTDAQERHPDDTVRAEARAAVETVAAHLAGEPTAHDPTGTKSGRIDNFHERFLAWAWLARCLKEHYGLPDPVSSYAYKAVERGTNDPDMMDHLRDVQAVLDTQELNAPRSVDEGLAELEEWPSDLGALGIIVETVVYMARMAADKARLPLAEVSAYLASCLD